MAEAKQNPNSLTFFLNGKKVEIQAQDVDPRVTLNQYIRTQTLFKGTKLGCGEGGCGACAVTVARWDAASGKEVYGSINSCLAPLPSLDGAAVTTTEGIGSVSADTSAEGKGPHPIQERIANFNGTQCGFCTPGMVMTLYSAIREAGPEGSAALTMKDIERKFDANLCRCTGYRPILDAAKSFGCDTTVTDGVIGTTEVGPVDTAAVDPAFPEQLKTYAKQQQAFNGPSAEWLRPVSLGQALAILSTPNPERRVMVSNTGSPFLPSQDSAVSQYVCVRDIPELNAVSALPDCLTVGAAVSISALFQHMTAFAESSSPALLSLLPFLTTRVANTHVRNAGSWGGNILLAKKTGFLSDLAPALVALGASLTIATAATATATAGGESKDGGDAAAATTALPGGGRVVDLGTFLSSDSGANAFSDADLLLSVSIPAQPKGRFLAGFKAALRPVNSHAIANLIGAVSTADGALSDAIIAVNGLGDTVLRLTAVEEVLNGRAVEPGLLDDVVAAAATAIDALITTDDKPEFTRRVIAGFVFKFCLALLSNAGLPLPPAAASAPASAAIESRPVSSGSQAFAAASDGSLPVGAPIRKVTALSQACGDAVFTDDFKAPFGTVYAAFFTTSQANAGIVSVDTSAAAASPGVVSVLTAKDIPAGGANDASFMPMEEEPLFATGESKYAGQPLGMVLADTPQQALSAARKVTAEYSKEGEFSDPPITSVAGSKAAAAAKEEAGAGSTEMPMGHTVTRGDAAAVIAAAEAEAASGSGSGSGSVVIEGTVSLGSQKHFYMEPQTASAMPDERGGMAVTAAFQWPGGMHGQVSKVLGTSMNNVTVTNRRMGGSFGGKCTRAAFTACAAAVGARSTGRPVRFALDRATDMALVGGRSEVEASYKAVVTAEGEVSAVEVRLDCAAGVGVDLTWFFTMAVMKAIDEAYYFPNFTGSSHAYFTHRPSRTVVRGPGEIQGSAVIETVLAHAATACGLSYSAVQQRNLYPADDESKLKTMSMDGGPPSDITHYTVPAMWQQLNQEAEVEARQAAVDAFNAANRWKKRGLSVTPVKYHVMSFTMGCLLNVYPDGSVRVTVCGTEMGQGLDTKVTQVVAQQLSAVLPSCGAGGSAQQRVPLSCIRMGDTSSDVRPNSSFTGGSTTSESSCGAAMNACAILAERLRPVVDKLVAEQAKAAAEAKGEGEGEGDGEGSEASPITWNDVVTAAVAAKVDMSVAADYQKEVGFSEQPHEYHNYGVCCSEVEVDVITGDTTILRSDIRYDCGQSLNPAIDIGQVEGAFMMGVGYFLREKLIVDAATGRLISDGTWEYKPPCAFDVPLQFNVALHENTEFDKGILSSKASGEPPLVLATSVWMAVRQAIASARSDVGLEGHFPLPAPLQVDDIAAACGTPDYSL